MPSINIPNETSLGPRLARSVGIGLLAVLLTYGWWHGVSPWAAVPIALIAATISDIFVVFRQMIPMAHFAVLISSLQYGLAPLMADYFPPVNSQYDILNFPRYFSYAGPVCLATAIGWIIMEAGSRFTQVKTRNKPLDQNLLRELDWLLWGGLILNYLSAGLGPGGLSFLVLLVANLRFVGGIGLILLRAQGWRWRTAVLLFCEAFGATGSGMFHDFILWSLCLLGAYAFMRRPQRVTLFVWLSLAAAGVFFLQNAKWTIRQATWGGTGEVTVFGRNMEFSSWTRPFVGGLCIVDSARKAFAEGYSDEFLSDTIIRFNQGWIVERVMRHIPDEEPYAHGITLWQSVEAALLPRILAPNKMIAGGRDKMTRYAGYELSEGTSMNLGFAGEMYANFGYGGGILGCGVYALILGLLFRWTAMRAQTSPLWWAIAAYAGHLAFKAETDVGSVLNYLVKASLVIFFLIMFLPAFRAELTGWKFSFNRRKSSFANPRSQPTAPTTSVAPQVSPVHSSNPAGRRPIAQRRPPRRGAINHTNR